MQQIGINSQFIKKSKILAYSNNNKYSKDFNCLYYNYGYKIVSLHNKFSKHRIVQHIIK